MGRFALPGRHHDVVYRGLPAVAMIFMMTMMKMMTQPLLDRRLAPAILQFLQIYIKTIHVISSFVGGA